MVTSKLVRNRLLNGLVISVIFMLIIPPIDLFYHMYLDNRPYLQVLSYEPTSEVINSCSDAEFLFSRRAFTNIQANYTEEIVAVETLQEFFRFSGNSFIQESNGAIITSVSIPCDIPPGQYFVRGVITFDFRGIHKIVTYQSEPFTII